MKLTSFLLLVLLLTSCLGDNRKDCSSIHLTFGYPAGNDSTENENVLDTYINNATIFVFDEASGQFIVSFDFSRDRLLAGSDLPISLPDGNYRIVCWGNVGENTDLNLDGSYANSSVRHPGYIDGTSSFPRTNDRLYYASTIVSVKNEVATEVHMDFVCAYITLEIYIHGLSPSAAPIVEVQHLTPEVDFDMQPLNPYSATYRPTVVYDVAGKRHTSRLHVFRFATDNPITLEILEPSGLSLYTLSLAEFMSTHDLPTQTVGNTRAITTEGVQELTIPIEITFKEVSITVNTPSWGNQGIAPGETELIDN